jgi:hypothetical protein
MGQLKRLRLIPNKTKKVAIDKHTSLLQSHTVLISASKARAYPLSAPSPSRNKYSTKLEKLGKNKHSSLLSDRGKKVFMRFPPEVKKEKNLSKNLGSLHNSCQVTNLKEKETHCLNLFPQGIEMDLRVRVSHQLILQKVRKENLRTGLAKNWRICQ